MFVHRVASTYGRLTIKPKDEVEAKEHVNEEKIPLHDQIEALRVKIQLKERYNKVLREDLEELKAGASTILQDLYTETTNLRNELHDALYSEISAVQNAVRSQRDFQLALDGTTPAIAVPWLKDKLFDLSKKIDSYLDVFLEKRNRLEDAEEMVLTIEKWPRPGTRPWELEAVATFHRLENAIEKRKINLETATILYSKYKDMKYMLRDEKGKYEPVIYQLEEQARILQKELLDLEKMLEQAVRFREDASRYLRVIEKDAAENRKRRRQQMTRMKLAVQKVLDANQAQTNNTTAAKATPKPGYFSGLYEAESVTYQHAEAYKLKASEVERYQEKARHIVEVMRVQDLTYIPKRYRNIMVLGIKLEMEQTSKEAFRDNLLKQKAQLELILTHSRYTGYNVTKEFHINVGLYAKAFEYEHDHIAKNEEKIEEYGGILITLRTGVLNLLGALDEGKRQHRLKDDFHRELQMLTSKIKKLVDSYESISKLFGKVPPSKNYAQYVKQNAVPQRLIRVGTPIIEEDSDDEEYIDLKIPSRADIKARSQKEVAQGKLRRGLFR